MNITDNVNLEDTNILSWDSVIDDNFSVFVIYPNHPSFNHLNGIYFKLFGVAFLDFESMSIFIDGQEISKEGYTPDHIYAIEAHEIAHFILEHDRKSEMPTTRQEKEADSVAIVILSYLNYHGAKDLLISRFQALYDADYSVESNLSEEDQIKLKEYLNKKSPNIFQRLINKIKRSLGFYKR
jgi:hypothetical protein